MRIALCQLNPTPGDLDGNAALLLERAEAAIEADADLLIASELFLSGYPPKDLLLRDGFVAACDRRLERLATELSPSLSVLVGHPTGRDLPPGCVANAVSLLEGGRRVATIAKSLLPNYDVFDEQRYFLPASHVAPITVRGMKLGVHICEDAWWGEEDTPYHLWSPPAVDPVAALARAGAELLVNISASPFESNKLERRLHIAKRHVASHGLPFVVVNQVGGNDDLVFDGRSFAIDDRGRCVATLAAFESDVAIVDSAALRGMDTDRADEMDASEPCREELLYRALVTGLRDYAHKSGFGHGVLGLSGGIDSALAAAVACEALGSMNVHGILMPSRYSSEHSVADAQQLADNLGLDAIVLPIDTIHRAYEALPIIGAELFGLTEQNLQARIRGALVMARSNHHGWLPLATGNKSELAVGYCTLYGDMVGGFAVLADVYKSDVYAIARWLNARAGRELIPSSTIEKPPSAELAPDQFDQDELPPYDVLDPILRGLVDEERSPAALGDEFSPELVTRVARLLDRSEFKRRQMPPGIKLSARAFGTGRRMPIAAKFRF